MNKRKGRWAALASAALTLTGAAAFAAESAPTLVDADSRSKHWMSGQGGAKQ